MPRLIVDYANILINKTIHLSKEDTNYLSNVLRLKRGDSITISNGQGKSFIARIVGRGILEVIDELQEIKEETFNLTLCQALLKGEKMELVIQKATELGIKRIIPFKSSRCIIRDTQKIERWRRIAKEASEQSGRNVVPEINHLIDFSRLIEEIDNGLLFWEGESIGLIDKFTELDLNKDIYLIIGPEGGFSEEEIEKARVKGIITASLGKRILRAETAAITAVAILVFLLQNYDIIKK